MDSSSAALADARARADNARERLVADLIAIKRWLAPRRLFGRAARQAADAGSQALTAGTEAVKARPGLAIGALALGALFLARKPIRRALSSAPKETPRPPARSNAKRPPAKRPRATAAKNRKAKP